MLPAGLCLRAVPPFVVINSDSEMVYDDTSLPWSLEGFHRGKREMLAQTVPQYQSHLLSIVSFTWTLICCKFRSLLCFGVMKAPWHQGSFIPQV